MFCFVASHHGVVYRFGSEAQATVLLLVLEKSAELESAVRACCSSVSHEFKTYRMNGTAAVLAS